MVDRSENDENLPIYSTNHALLKAKSNQESSNLRILSDENLDQDDDESNFFNKDDIEEGKPKTIVTARATPVKTNSLARKNHSSVRR